mmetsp:Transcript_22297/g.56830  ORF Transcript_22297/g.56830 Transcript_22297/m.56830 type:complete len:1191 (-) Transcript_22297:1414-4986(-)
MQHGRDPVPAVPVVGEPPVVAYDVGFGLGGGGDPDVAPGGVGLGGAAGLGGAEVGLAAADAADHGGLGVVRAGGSRAVLDDLHPLPGSGAVIQVRLRRQVDSSNREVEVHVRLHDLPGQPGQAEAGVPGDPLGGDVVAVAALHGLDVQLQEAGEGLGVVLPGPAPVLDLVNAQLLAVTRRRDVPLEGQELPEDVQVALPADGHERSHGGAGLAFLQGGRVAALVGSVGLEDIGGHRGDVLLVLGVLHGPMLSPAHDMGGGGLDLGGGVRPVLLPPAEELYAAGEVLLVLGGAAAVRGAGGDLHALDVHWVRGLDRKIHDHGAAVGLVHRVGVAVQALAPELGLHCRVPRVSCQERLVHPLDRRVRVVGHRLLPQRRVRLRDHHRGSVRAHDGRGALIIRKHLDLPDPPAVIHAGAVGEAEVVGLGDVGLLDADLRGLAVDDLEDPEAAGEGVLHGIPGRADRLPHGPRIVPHPLEALHVRKRRRIRVLAPTLRRTSVVPLLLNLHREHPVPRVRHGDLHHVRGAEEQAVAPEVGGAGGVDVQVEVEVAGVVAGGVEGLHADHVRVPLIVAVWHRQRVLGSIRRDELPGEEVQVGRRQRDHQLVRGSWRSHCHPDGPGDVPVDLLGPLPLGAGDEGFGTLDGRQDLGVEPPVFTDRGLLRHHRIPGVRGPDHGQLVGEAPLGQHAGGELRAVGVLIAQKIHRAILTVLRAEPEQLADRVRQEGLRIRDPRGHCRTGPVGEGHVVAGVHTSHVMLHDPPGPDPRGVPAVGRAHGGLGGPVGVDVVGELLLVGPDQPGARGAVVVALEGAGAAGGEGAAVGVGPLLLVVAVKLSSGRMPGDPRSTREVVPLWVVGPILVTVRDDLPLQHIVRRHPVKDPVPVAGVEGPGGRGVVGDLAVRGAVPAVYIPLRGIEQLAPVPPLEHLEPRAVRGVRTEELAQLPVHTEGPALFQVRHLHTITLRGLRCQAVAADPQVAGVAVPALPIQCASSALAPAEASELLVLGEPGPDVPPGGAQPPPQDRCGDGSVLTGGEALAEREGLEGDHSGGLLRKIVLGVLHGAQGIGVVPAGRGVEVAPRPRAVHLDAATAIPQHVAQHLAALPRHTEGVGVHVEGRIGPLAVGVRPRLAVLLRGVRRVTLLVAGLRSYGGLDGGPLLRRAVPRAHVRQHGARRLHCPGRGGVGNVDVVVLTVPL